MYSLPFYKSKSKQKQLVGPPALEISDILFKASEFLEIRDICNLKYVCRDLHNLINDNPLPIQSLLCNTVSSHRLEFWKYVFKIEEKRHNDPTLYSCCKVSNPKILHLSKDGVEGEILRDITRTFPHHPLFRDSSSLGVTLLGNLLKSCSLYNTNIGYCQGMNFVAAVFLFLYLDPNFVGYSSDCNVDELVNKCLELNIDEVLEYSFWMMVSIIDSYHLREFWMPGIPGMPIRVYQFDRIFRRELPLLRKHCVENELFSDFFVAQWFITLFAYLLPPQALCRVWDIYFVQGWCFVFRLSIAILQHLQPQLLTMDLGSMCSLLKDLKNIFQKEPDLIIELINISIFIKIDDKLLNDLERDFNAKEYQLKFENCPESLNDIDELISNNPSMTAICASFRHKIEIVTEKIAVTNSQFNELILEHSEYTLLYQEQVDRKEILQDQLLQLLSKNSEKDIEKEEEEEKEKEENRIKGKEETKNHNNNNNRMKKIKKIIFNNYNYDYEEEKKKRKEKEIEKNDIDYYRSKISDLSREIVETENKLQNIIMKYALTKANLDEYNEKKSLYSHELTELLKQSEQEHINRSLGIVENETRS